MTSVKSSESSGTRVDKKVRSSEFRVSSKQLIDACAATADELAKTRVLVDSLERENQAVKERLENEKITTTIMRELIDTRRQESEVLRTALNAKNDTLVAKDAVIGLQAKMIETLKKKKASPWRRLGDVLIGAAMFAILK